MIEYWYKIKHSLFPKFLAFLAKKLIFVVLKTCDVTVKGLDNIELIKDKKVMLLFWHNRLVLAPALLYKYCGQKKFGVLVSKSRDGEIISSIVNSYKIAQSIRVAHNSKIEALNRAVDYINEKNGLLVITPDGPRGPRYKIKKGTAYIAKNSKATLIAMSWSTNKFWRLNSWDRLIIPRPFSKIVLSFGSPFKLSEGSNLPTNSDIEEIESQLNEIKKINLNELTGVTF